MGRKGRLGQAEIQDTTRRHTDSSEEYLKGKREVSKQAERERESWKSGRRILVNQNPQSRSDHTLQRGLFQPWQSVKDQERTPTQTRAHWQETKKHPPYTLRANNTNNNRSGDMKGTANT